jgi:hypothetical protein
MIHLVILAGHLLAIIVKVVRPGGVRAVVAESLDGCSRDAFHGLYSLMAPTKPYPDLHLPENQSVRFLGSSHFAVARPAY